MLRSWKCWNGALLLWLVAALVWSGAAWAQTISFSMRFPGKLKDRSHFKRMLNKQLRVQLVRNGFGVSGSRVRQGFHIIIRVSVEEELSADDPATCAIAIDAKVVMYPQKRLVAHDISATGSGKYNQAAKVTTPRLRKLRLIAARSVATYMGRNLRQLFRQIQAKLKTLKKGQVLGRKIRSIGGGGGGGKGRSGGRDGKPLLGPPPQLKLIPARVDPKRARPTFRPKRK